MFLKNWQNSQENTCARVTFFNKVTGLRLTTLLKKRLWHRCFSVNFVKFLRTPFLQNTFGQLLMHLVDWKQIYNYYWCVGWNILIVNIDPQHFHKKPNFFLILKWVGWLSNWLFWTRMDLNLSGYAFPENQLIIVHTKQSGGFPNWS